MVVVSSLFKEDDWLNMVFLNSISSALLLLMIIECCDVCHDHSAFILNANSTSSTWGLLINVVKGGLLVFLTFLASNDYVFQYQFGSTTVLNCSKFFL